MMRYQMQDRAAKLLERADERIALGSESSLRAAAVLTEMARVWAELAKSAS